MENELYALQSQVNPDRAQQELVILYDNKNLANLCLQNIAVLLLDTTFQGISFISAMKYHILSTTVCTGSTRTIR